jgi:Ca2+-binding RTX toxin-like protein
VRGRGGDDRIRGEHGDDDLSGGGGDDKLNGGRGEDAIKGRSGRDVINARDDLVDRVSCGRGRDRAKLDGFDHLVDVCERVRRPFPPGATVIGGLFEDGRLRIDVGCPRDAPPRCRGRIAVLRRGERIAGRRLNLRRGRLRELVLDISDDVAEDIADASRYVVTVLGLVRDRLGRTRIIRVRIDLAD